MLKCKNCGSDRIHYEANGVISEMTELGDLKFYYRESIKFDDPMIRCCGCDSTNEETGLTFKNGKIEREEKDEKGMA